MTMYRIVPSNSFKRDLKAMMKRGYDLTPLEVVVDMIASGQKLPSRYRDHALIGEYKNCRECHLKPDWLLIYELEDNDLLLYLMRTGSHSDLFR